MVNLRFVKPVSLFLTLCTKIEIKVMMQRELILRVFEKNIFMDWVEAD
jgi:hypothetical protein